ncbi:hypothetical protein A2U01_0010553 [Trifolium medium]|uniref:Uncharacterized protein n=1 Tax=Trifolium medium TaxID=97028 RepID=A0A392MQU3_9FABA|nr:hypothetical protein [Trifolium medium]
MRCGPNLPALMYDSEGTQLFPLYWTGDLRAIKGVHDAHLATFERETVVFLDSFCRLDNKELLQCETDIESIVVYLKRMRTISEDDWLSYLAKSKQKKLEPEALVSPNVQLVVGEADGAKGVRTLQSRTTAPAKPAGEDIVVQEGVSDVQRDAAMKDVVESAVMEIDTTEANKDTVPPPVVVSAGDGDKPSAWEETFDPIAFVERNLVMQGDSSRFNSMATSELRKLALNHEVKGMVLSHLLFARQENEVSEACGQTSRVEKAAKEMENRHTEAERKYIVEIESLKNAHLEEIARLKK